MSFLNFAPSTQKFQWGTQRGIGAILAGENQQSSGFVSGYLYLPSSHHLLFEYTTEFNLNNASEATSCGLNTTNSLLPE